VVNAAAMCEITDMPSRPPLPTSGQLLGLVVNALRHRQALEEAVPARTLGRVLRGKPGIKRETLREVVDAVVRVLIKPELLRAYDLIPQEAMTEVPAATFHTKLSDAVEGVMVAWDAAAGSLRASGPAVERCEWAMLPWLRLLAVELGLRVAAYMKARGIQFTQEDAKAFIDGRAFIRLLNRYRADADRLTRDDLAEGTGLWRSAIDEWLAGRALPQSKSIEYLAEVVSEAIDDLSAPEAELHLRVAVAATELVGWLWEVCPPPMPDQPAAFGPARAASFGLEFTTVLNVNSELLAEVEEQSASQFDFWMLVVNGSMWPSAVPLLMALLHGARDSYLRADIEGVINGRWAERVLLMYRQLPNPSNREREAQTLRDLGFPELPPQMFPWMEEQIRWGKLSPNPNGWHFPTFPSPTEPEAQDDEHVVLGFSEESFPNRPDVVSKHAMEANHLRGDPQEALAHHRHLVAGDPENEMYRFWLGASLAAVGQLDEALIECRMACALEPGWSLPAVEVAIILLNAGRYDEALSSIELTANNYGLDAHLANVHGRALLALEREREARPWFQKVLELNDQHAGAMQDLAHCLLTIGERAEGRKWAKAAAHAGAGAVLHDLNAGRYDK
jgi:tetratricopeptide (TPR) repeat protein/transcriptional regulator with XRE-family HTH domain